MEPTLLLKALTLAETGDWQSAHHIVQDDERDTLACWIHAVLHKIEGDAWNSRYWYARTSHSYEEWSNPNAELAALRTSIGERND